MFTQPQNTLVFLKISHLQAESHIKQGICLLVIPVRICLLVTPVHIIAPCFHAGNCLFVPDGLLFVKCG